jgi:uncharacterized protein (DUF2235 family)
MSKRLVVCCDGTWNKPDQMRGGVRAPTNVLKLALGVSRQDSDGTEQLLHYQGGVGTLRHQRVTGGAFGYGLSRNVLACYRFLVEHYEPGDDLYFFGFSRGAYTARSTAGLVRNCGILQPEHAGRLRQAYGLYRSRSSATHPSSAASRIFRRMYSHDPVKVHFIGVWDTVGALGIPIDGWRAPFVDRLWGFHDTELSSHVSAAYHALAIDEQRGPFKPTIWKRQADDTARGQILEQVWFAGVHCDVGGGYVEPELAEIPLRWMVGCARRHALAFDREHFTVNPAAPDESRWTGADLAPNALGMIHDSRRGLYRLVPRHERTLEDRDGQSVGSSAVRRVREKPPYGSPSLHGWLAAGRRQTAVEVTPTPSVTAHAV